MKLSSLSLAIITTCGVNAAMADTAVDRTGLWLGAGLGSGFLTESVLDIKNNIKDDIKTSRFSSKLDMGYDFNDYMGVYGSYDYLQHTWSKYDLHIGTVGLKGRESLTDNLSLFGKLGVSYLIGEKNDSGVTGVVGVGLEYQLTNAVSTKIGFDYYNDLEINSNSMGDLSQVYWGMSYRFGQPSTPMIITKTVEVIREVEVIKILKPDSIIFSVSSEILFSNNSRLLLSTKSLEGPLKTLNDDERLTISFTGYTDSNGSAKYNQWLSEKRAESVSDYFKSNGISASRITVYGKGESNPIATNKTELGRTQNRRVEITISNINKVTR